MLCNRKSSPPHKLTTPLPIAGSGNDRELDVFGGVVGWVRKCKLAWLGLAWLSSARLGRARGTAKSAPCQLAASSVALSLTVSVSTTVGRNKLTINAESVCNHEQEVGSGRSARFLLLKFKCESKQPVQRRFSHAV